MNKTAIKNFAIWARNKLIADISFQAGLAGITESGIAAELPQSSGNVKFYDVGTKDPVSISGEKVKMRQRLMDAIREKETEVGYKEAFRFVVEKVAYTWFNRLIAIRFMEVNDYLPGRVRVLSSENQMKAEPDIVTSPFDSDLTFTDQEKKNILLMKNENRLDELFRFLFICQCHELHKALPVLFDEGTGIDRKDSYLELLLSISFTDKDGVLWHLVHDISEDDFNVEKEGQVEIIGWLYQYYNSEPKDKVFANLKKNIKINKDNIPAATQLFTPDWIVRYMVENSLGRLWTEGHPNEGLKKNWKYYLEEAEQEPTVTKQLEEIRKGYAAIKPEEIKVIDPCSGSGHILVYFFEVLMQIYESQGWTQREAAQSIVQNNLYGLDIDDRAAQLAYFAVMMKARQYDRHFLERGIVPHVFGIQESNGINREHIKLFGNGMSMLEKNNAVNQLNEMLDVLRDAKEYGSILNMPELNWDLLRGYTAAMDNSMQITLDNVGAEDTLEAVCALIEQAQSMAQRYDIIVTNPPYMGNTGMNYTLTDYVKAHYNDVKMDLFSCMMDKALRWCSDRGFVSMITMESWMFLSSYEVLRKRLLSSMSIANMIHMPYLGTGGTSLGISFGTSAFSLRKSLLKEYVSKFMCIRYYETDSEGIPESYPVINERYSEKKADLFEKIPSMQIAYWASSELLSAFEFGENIQKYVDTFQGIITGDNDKFLRLWFEIDHNRIAFNYKTIEDVPISTKPWIPYNKGGDFRKWYGNQDYVVDWKNGPDDKTRGKKGFSHYYLREYMSWSYITSSTLACRYFPSGFLWDVHGSGIFDKSDMLFYLQGLIGSKVGMALLRVINSTISYQVENIAQIPVVMSENDKPEIDMLVKQNISLAKKDWDFFETSWCFSRHPLIKNNDSLISKAYETWSAELDEMTYKTYKNEARITEIFARIYKISNQELQYVEDRETTIHKPNLHNDIASLISYAVGCMLGRYSLDVDGLAYAGGTWNVGKYKTYQPDADNCIPITDESYFDDDIVGRFVEFIRIIYGAETLEENLAFIANALGNKGNSSREIIRNYFLNDFFKDHCATYSVTGSGKRPIYWLFDSGKQNGFKALVYMHRWNADTVGNLRVEYLHRMQRIYEKEIERMQDIVDNSRDNREVNQASKRLEKLVKQLKEARDYDVKIAHAALSRVEIDLDDGVKVNYEKVQRGPDGKSLGILAKI